MLEPLGHDALPDAGLLRGQRRRRVDRIAAPQQRVAQHDLLAQRDDAGGLQLAQERQERWGQRVEFVPPERLPGRGQGIDDRAIFVGAAQCQQQLGRGVITELQGHLSPLNADGAQFAQSLDRAVAA